MPRAAGVVAVVIAGLAAVLAGCASSGRGPSPTPNGPDATPMVRREPPATGLEKLFSGGYAIKVQPLLTVPNSGLQLPAVSPDGQTLAYLDNPRDQPAAREMIGPRPTPGVALYTQPLTPDSHVRRILIENGAGWPAFGPDGNTLVAVRRDSPDTSRLVLAPLDGEPAKVIGPGIGHIQSPRFSPDGLYLAAAGYKEQAGQSRVYVVQPDTQRTVAVPMPDRGVFQISPVWVGPRTLVFALGTEQAVELHRWSLGEPETTALGQLPIQPATASGVLQAFAGVADPLDPTRRRLLFYSQPLNRLLSVNLDTGTLHAMPRGTLSGCWLGPDHVVCATPKAMWIQRIAGETSGGGASGGETSGGGGSPHRLLEGRLLPVHARESADGVRIIACSSNQDADHFGVVRIEIGPR